MDQENRAELIPLEERPLLDKYVEIALEGVLDPVHTLIMRSPEKVSRLEVQKFLNSPARKEYIDAQLELFINTRTLDHARSVKELRDMSFHDPSELYEDRDEVFLDIAGRPTKKQVTALRPLSQMPKGAMKLIKKIKYTPTGLPEVEFYSRLDAIKALTKIQDTTNRRPPTDPNATKKVGLFDLASANTPKNEDSSKSEKTTPPHPLNRIDPDNLVIDLDPEEDISRFSENVYDTKPLDKKGPKK